MLAVGPGKKNDKGEVIALNVKVGDRVLFGKYSGQTVKVNGDELLVMKEDDLFAVVENNCYCAVPGVVGRCSESSRTGSVSGSCAPSPSL